MTIGTYAPDTYDGGAGVTTFVITFEFYANSEIAVKVRDDSAGTDTDWVLDTDFTIANRTGSDPFTGGEVEATTPPVSGETIVIYRVSAQTQTTDLQTGGQLPSDDLEDRYNKNVMMIQEIQDQVNRCIQLPITDDPATDYAANYQIVGNAVSRASKFLVFASDGSPTVSDSVVSSEAIVSSWAEPLIAANGALAARTVLELGTAATLASDTDNTLAADSDTRIATQKATKGYVDNTAVLKTGAQTIAGVKTISDEMAFSVFPITPTGAPDADYEVANKKFVDDNTSATVVVKVVNVQVDAVSTGTTIMPWDDTIPQNNEGDEYMTLAITPNAVTNYLKIEVSIQLAHTGNLLAMTAALFKDTDSDALAAISQVQHQNDPEVLHFTHYMLATGMTGAVTFKIRAGATGTGATTTFNGASGARKLGGVVASSITITEILV